MEIECKDNKNIEKIAVLCEKDEDITSILSKNTIDNMKAFLVAYSKSQLTRVIKLTNTLDKLESELIDRALDNEFIEPEVLINITKTIQNSLDSALKMIKQVTTDSSYINVIVDNSKTINNTINQVNIDDKVPVLNSKDSREKVRLVVNQILDKVKALEED